MELVPREEGLDPLLTSPLPGGLSPILGRFRSEDSPLYRQLEKSTYRKTLASSMRETDVAVPDGR